MEQNKQMGIVEALVDIAKGGLKYASNAAVAISGAVVACAHQDRGMIAMGCGLVGMAGGVIFLKYWAGRKK